MKGNYLNAFLFNFFALQGDIMEKRRVRSDPVDCTPPEYIMPGTYIQTHTLAHTQTIEKTTQIFIDIQIYNTNEDNASLFDY